MIGDKATIVSVFCFAAGAVDRAVDFASTLYSYGVFCSDVICRLLVVVAIASPLALALASPWIRHLRRYVYSRKHLYTTVRRNEE